jgi:hypothetical protein
MEGFQMEGFQMEGFQMEDRTTRQVGTNRETAFWRNP